MILLLFSPGCAVIEGLVDSQSADGARVEGVAGIDPAPWTGLDLQDDASDFEFIVVTDRTGEHRKGIFRDAMPRINLIQPAFVLSVGDLIEGYTEDSFELDTQWDEIRDMVGVLDMPFFYAPGNHDISNAVMAEKWRERFGPSYYRFIYKDVLFVILNSELFGMVSEPNRSVPGPDTQQEQMAWLEQVLAENEHRRHTFVLVHQPLWDRSHPHPDWERVEGWLGSRPYSVLAGHVHAYTKHVRHDRRYITLATTGGGSAMRGVDHGEFDHVLLVSMTPEGPVLANLLLEGIHDENVRLAQTRARMDALEHAVVMVEGERIGPSIREASVAFDIRNTTVDPLRVRGVFEGRDSFSVAPEEVDFFLAAGESRRVVLELRADRERDLRHIEVPMASWRLESSKADGSPLVVKRNAWLLPPGRFAIHPAEQEIVIDGSLGEWGELPYWAGTRGRGFDTDSGSRFRFDLAFDADFVYLAVDVLDATPVISNDLVARKQDAVRVTLDARGDPERSRSGPDFFGAIRDGTLGQLFFLWLTPADAKADSLLGRWLPPLPAGTRRAAMATAGGYSAEIAIPSRWLDEKQGRSWGAFRLEVGIQDLPGRGEDPEDYNFRPSRFDSGGTLPMPASATFDRRE